MFLYNLPKRFLLIVTLALIFLFFPFLSGAFSSLEGELSEAVSGLNAVEEAEAQREQEEENGGYKPAHYPSAELITLADLEIGDRVVDSSWSWEFRSSGESRSCNKPVTWIVVAKDHYGPNSGVTLLAEELIGSVAFDNSTNRGSEHGTGHWGDSGSDNATEGIRPWINSTGIHSDEGFYNAFSEKFKDSINTTTLPNRTWDGESYDYYTEDKVFIPSGGELLLAYDGTSIYQYFSSKPSTYRIAPLVNTNRNYITRTQHGEHINVNYVINYEGGWTYTL